jgi:hypothetical protein
MYQLLKNHLAETLTPHEKASSVKTKTLQNERKKYQHRVIGFFQGA